MGAMSFEIAFELWSRLSVCHATSSAYRFQLARLVPLDVWHTTAPLGLGGSSPYFQNSMHACILHVLLQLILDNATGMGNGMVFCASIPTSTLLGTSESDMFQSR